VHVTGLNDNRYVVTNGRALPLQSTGRVGEFVAGVRYKAWNPPSAPSVGMHAPLTLTRHLMERSAGLHVAHPGGPLKLRASPVNFRNEAEAAASTRFYGPHAGQDAGIAPALPSREFPYAGPALSSHCCSLMKPPGCGCSRGRRQQD
jgi:uncharacterized protein (DUF2126 family)